MESARKRLARQAFAGGSALILAVVLTSLLAIIGVMFLMTSRVERMATSAVSQRRDLDLAVDAVIESISQQLIWDVPGANIPGIGFAEYHDYPGPEDEWLAVIEPYDDGAAVPASRYFWLHISDVTGYLRAMNWPRADVPIWEIPDDAAIVLAANGSLLEQLADADGDGVSDAKWIVLDGIASSKGRPIYAAIRIIDNCGMININTAFKFDPCDPNLVDGTSLTQINLMGLAARPGDPFNPGDDTALLLARANDGFGVDPNLDSYERSVTWRYGELSEPYTPFDISDEMELRNRFLLNQRDISVRIENLGWAGSFAAATGLKVPIGQGGSSSTIHDWFDRANISRDLNSYDYRHLATAYSMDRIINPAGGLSRWRPGVPRTWTVAKMENVNAASKNVLHREITAGILDADPMLDPNVATALAAQIAVNIKDFRDSDLTVTTMTDSNGVKHYGFERPCIYISEVAGANSVSGKKSYAVELHKPYFEDRDPSGWRLSISNPPANINIDWSGTRRYHVIQFEDPCAPLSATLSDPNEPINPFPIFHYNRNDAPIPQDANNLLVFGPGSTIELRRPAPGGSIPVDSVKVPDANAGGKWLWTTGVVHSIQRDITRHKCIRKLWNAPGDPNSTLGAFNSFTDSADANMVQAHPYLDPSVYGDGVKFKNIGEIGKVFARSGYDVPAGSTGADLLLDFQNPLFAEILNYLTVIDPEDHGHQSDEKRIRGRININTAPPYVLEQLPWMTPAPVGPIIADAVANYRDNVLPVRRGLGGFRSIGELTWVPEMGYYARDGVDQDGFPDLTAAELRKINDNMSIDDAVDDFEERDLIFHRISNLVTVRSDVFSAYILVRIGADGPQKRVIAILDRSEVDQYGTPIVKVRALHPVADPW